MSEFLKQMVRRKWGPYLILLVILAGTAVFYAPSIHFGAIWDDPVWYGHAVGKTWLQTLPPITDFQFYRPLTMLYVWLFSRPDGSFALVWQHWLQIGFHLLNVILAFAIASRLGLSRWAGVAVSLLLAFYPFAYQAVAWAAPQQPIVGLWQSAAWLAYLAARPLPGLETREWKLGRKGSLGIGVSLLFFLLALLMQESSVAVALLPLLYEFLLRQKVTSWPSFLRALRSPGNKGWGAALAYAALAGIYGLIWLAVPRQAGITQLALEPETVVYLLQGLVYPLLGRPLGYQSPLPVGQFWVITAVTLTALLSLAVWHKRGRLALLALIWLVLSQAPAFVGLRFSYVGGASRLLYAAVLPIGLLWAAALWPSPRWPSSRWQWRTAWPGPFLILLIVGQSVWLMTGMARDFERGTSHLNEAISTMAQPSRGLEGNGRFLFINFPDRYKPKQPPYPFGYWGLTLAPVVVDLADFVPLVAGKTAVSTSYSMPWLDLAEREAGPYQIDMRGVIIQPGELVQLADGAAIYVSRYGVDGSFQLQQVGALGQAVRPAGCLVQFEESICLHAVNYAVGEVEIEVMLAWSTERPLLPNQTIFMHLGQPGQPPLVQADGDTWRGLLPLSDWPTGRLVMEYRTLPRLPSEGLALQIGVYNRETGQRLLTDTAVDYFSLPLE
jgi:hypothetical protein